MWLILQLLVLGPLWAANLEDHYLKSLASAHDGGEIERLRGEYSHLKVAQLACSIQLREHSVPVSCYEAVELEAKLDRGGDSRRKAERLHRLDRLCARAAADLHLNPETADVSPACAKKIAAARTIQVYRDEENADWSKY